MNLVIAEAEFENEIICTKEESTLQMFAGNYRDSTGKSECRDFKFMGIAIPVILKPTH